MNGKSGERCFRTSHYLLLIMIVVMTAAGGYEARAQATVCYPDCEASVWVPSPQNFPYSFAVTLPCGESVVVFYRIRYACNEWYDLFIERIHFFNGYNGGIHCGETMSVADMVNNIVEQMIVQNPMNFPPTNPSKDTCVERYRVMLSPCWTTSFPVATHGAAAERSGSESGLDSDLNSSGSSSQLDNSQNGFLEPCLNLKCCIQSYQVCFVNGQKIITYKPESSAPGECDPSYYDCQPVCE